MYIIAKCDFKDTRKVAWYVKVDILRKFVQYIIHWDKTQMFKKNSYGQNKRYKKCTLFFFRELQLITFYF